MRIESAAHGANTTPHSNAARMLVVLAHELRGPLAPIRYAATSLAMQIPDGTPSRKSVGIIERQLTAIESLIESILEAARLDHELRPLHWTRVNLGEIVADAAETVSTYVAERGHALVVHCPGTPLEVNGDIGQLGQIVRNLVTNAAKYTDRGGRIDVRATASDHTARIVVRDTGIGLLPHQLESIFDLYSQEGQRGTARSDGGLGIGLYVARQVALAHGGTLVATSRGVNRGSEFVVTLPLAADSAQSGSFEPQAQDPGIHCVAPEQPAGTQWRGRQRLRRCRRS